MSASTPDRDSPSAGASLPERTALVASLRRWAAELGFARLGVAAIDLAGDEAHFLAWLEAGFQGEMAYMSRHGVKRSRPAELVPGTVSCLSLTMHYWPAGAADAQRVLGAPTQAYVSRYALGRDYHKLMRSRLQRLADRVVSAVGPFGYRVFTDSAPVLERALARDAGLGWIGKHTNLINRDAGSYFFLGEIYVDLDLPADAPGSAHCGSCSACLPACPTGAIVAPYRLDARRCISYLTIELAGPIPEEFRRAIGNRIYGCDDCLAVCPWNKFAKAGHEQKLAHRDDLIAPKLVELATLTDAQFRERFSASPIKRTGRNRFIRNVAIAIGNSRDKLLYRAAQALAGDADPVVAEAGAWAAAQFQTMTTPPEAAR
jgi:epoxyqueuosine reductase